MTTTRQYLTRIEQLYRGTGCAITVALAPEERPVHRRAGGGEVMANVFISYARNDAQFVRDQLLEALRQLGYTVWIDLESIPGSVEWWNAITQSIANTSAVIVVLSPNSCASPYVAKELAHAQSCQRPILPVLLQGCQLPDVLAWLRQVQWIDFTKEQFHSALGRLDFGLRYVGVAPVPRRPLRRLPLRSLSRRSFLGIGELIFSISK